LLKISEAYEIVAKKALASRLLWETLPLSAAMGRITAQAIRSPIDLPPFNKSAMDGYAIPEGEFLDEYIIDATLPAGSVYADPIEPGHCIKIMTGAEVPPGIARIVPWEDTDRGESIVRILTKSNRTNIAEQGEDICKDDILCQAGNILTPLNIANLAIAGVDSVQVSRVPRAVVFSTGDELLPVGASLAPGKIYDSNGPMLIALLMECGIPIMFTGHLPDSLDKSIAGLQRALAVAEVILLTGAVSKGEFDFLPETFRRCGLETYFDEVSIKPGKPTTFSTAGNKLIFGLPGNPVSSFLMFHLFVKPALYMMQGHIIHPRPVSIELAVEFRAKESDRMRFLPARLDTDGRIIPLEYHGSGHLLALADADGFIEVGTEETCLSPGERLPFWPIMLRGYERVTA